MRGELLRMWTEGIIRRRTNGELKKNLTEQIRNELFPKKMSDALHLWCIVTLLQFVKTPGSLMYRRPVLLSVPDYKNEKRGEMKETWGRSCISKLDTRLRLPRRYR